MCAIKQLLNWVVRKYSHGYEYNAKHEYSIVIWLYAIASFIKAIVGGARIACEAFQSNSFSGMRTPIFSIQSKLANGAYK